MKMNEGTLQICLPKSETSTASQRHLEIPPSTQVNLEDVEDFSNVCRICATVTELVIPIFNGEGLLNNLAEKICKHLPIQVCEEDVLPLVVCYQCSSTILAWHELVQCSLQADRALRTTLAAHAHAHLHNHKPPPDGPAPDNETNQNTVKSQTTTKEQDKKFQEVTDPAGRTESPARAATHASYTTPTPEHRDVMFLCKECDTYVHRRDFVLHMSLHAVHYATFKLRPKQYKKNEPGDSDDVAIGEEPRSAQPPKSERPNDEIRDDSEDTSEENGSEEATDNREDEFSDHSDMDFGTLPESVFEAIEDTQDGQPIEDEPANPTPEPDAPLGGVDSDSTAPKTGRKTTSRRRARACPICSKVYTAPSSYFYHMKYCHNENKEHECDVCGKKFGTKASLRQHKPLHTGECPYACDECDKRFRSRASLYCHKQTHSSVRRWPCAQCPRSFVSRAQAARHAARHAARRAHKCADCGQGFNVRYDLLRHKLTHDKHKFSCDKCPVKFAQLRYLKVHLKNKH